MLEDNITVQKDEGCVGGLCGREECENSKILAFTSYGQHLEIKKTDKRKCIPTDR